MSVTAPLTDDQVRGIVLLLNGGRVDRRRQPKKCEQAPLKLERTCKGKRGRTIPLQFFVPIKGMRNGYYGCCHECRAKLVRERYWASADEREKQKARARRIREKRLAATPPWT